MLRLFALLTLLTINPSFAFATNTLTGDVFEYKTDEPIEGIKVFISYSKGEKGIEGDETDSYFSQGKL